MIATSHLVEHRVPGEPGLDVGVVDVAGELGGDLDVLLVGVGAEASFTLLAVLLAKRIGIEGNVPDQFGDGWLDLHVTDRTEARPTWPTRSAACQIRRTAAHQ